MERKRLPYSFYESFTTIELAKHLLGCELVHDSPAGTTSGIIVETEAYLFDDPACHAFNKRTPRTEPMFGSPGTIYMYLIYGMYQCINVVSNVTGVGEAVLIRALEPVRGIQLMQERRRDNKADSSTFSNKNLCNGPGKLVISMGLTKEEFNNKTLMEDRLYLLPSTNLDIEINTSPRIGINVGKELPYRFSINKNIFVSK